MEDGRITDIGIHEDLISRPGTYQDVYRIQMETMQEGGDS
jgi:ABC-type multidrug transport system fused ATPase/permease subunit